MNTNTYFDAVFASTKSTHTVRWRSEFEKRLMTFFDQDSRIADYFQPQMAAVVKLDDSEYSVEMDFWLEYASGRIILLHIERTNEFPPEAKKRILANAKSRFKQDGLDLVIVRDSLPDQSRSNASSSKLKHNFTEIPKLIFEN